MFASLTNKGPDERGIDREMNDRALAPEFVLAAACCRPPAEARNTAVSAVVDCVDRAAFHRVLARHRVEGLAHEALVAAGVAPDPVLRQTAGEIALEGLRLAAETGRLQLALDVAGVANLVLKGATLDVLAWGRIGLKRAWDIDLLVTPDDARRARHVLEGLGYDLRDPADSSDMAFAAWVALAKESVFRHRQSGVVVELHWRLADAATLLPDISARSPAQCVRLSGGLVLRTLASDELFAYLCVHGASHAWSRLKWIADLGALLAREDDGGQIELYRRSLDLGAGNCSAAALQLCEALFGTPPPAALIAEIRPNSKAGKLAALAMDALSHGGGEAEIDTRPLFKDRILLSHFLFADGWRFRLAEWRRQGVSIDDHIRLRLPPWLSFLYGPIRAPLWLWRRIVRRLSRP